jgi:hypothetical protein
VRVTKPRRGRRPVKRLDMSPVLEALKDHRQWTALGVVTQPEDGSAHWQIYGDNADVLVEVVLQPSQEPVTARLAAGMWIVPNVGDEVAVLLPAGEIDFMPVITCILAHAVPSTQGPQPQRILIVSGEVVIHDGGADKIPTMADLAKVESAIAGATVVAGDGGASLKATMAAGLPSSLHGEDGSGTWPVGTTVLKAK